MSIRVVRNTLDSLERDLKALPIVAVKDMKACVRKAGIAGNKVAKDHATFTARSHGKHYPNAFSVDHGAAVAGGAAAFTAAYGPDASRPQGGMSFERGSRRQPPHLDLKLSADLMGPVFARMVHDLPDGWFW